MVQHPTYNTQSPSLSTVCQTRIELLDRLADIVASLGIAKLELTSAVESGDQFLCHSAQATVETLRGDCNRLKAELEAHRARHRC